MRFFMHSIISVVLSCLLLIECVYSKKETSWEKPVIITTSFAPNYLWHLLAVAEIVYSSDYAERYQHTVNPDDIQFLKEHSQFIAFGDGKAGPFTFLIIFFPSYLEFENVSEYEEYFNLLLAGFEGFDFSAFKARYSQVRWDDPFIEISAGIFDPPVEYRDSIRQQLPLFEQFAAVVMNNLDAYRSSAWDEAQRAMQPRVDELSIIFAEKNYIRKWEEKMQMSFEAEEYRIFLCYASRNGPNANSLSYEKNVFYYDYPIRPTIQFISHEIGTHILFYEYIQMFQSGKYEPAALYAAYESLAMFYNRKILGEEGFEYSLGQFYDTYYLSLYEDYYEEGISPRELLSMVIEKDHREEKTSYSPASAPQGTPLILKHLVLWRPACTW